MFTLTMRFTLPKDTDWSKIPSLMEALAAKQDFRRLYIDWSSGAVVMVKTK